MTHHENKVPFLSLAFSNNQVKDEVINSLKNVIESDWYILGKYCSEFEKNYADFHGVPHCVGVGNGLDALVISLRSLGIGPGG